MFADGHWFAGFEVLIAVTIKRMVVWVVTPCCSKKAGLEHASAAFSPAYTALLLRNSSLKSCFENVMTFRNFGTVE
jgi:hypothetical protein